MSHIDVMKQALEALEHCKDVIVERGLNGSPEFAEKWGLTLPLERTESAITTLRQALADAALDKMADNARELGLSYDASVAQIDTSAERVEKEAENVHEQPAPAQEPDLSEQGRTRSAILGNNVEAMMDAGLPVLTALETTLKVYDHDTPKIGCVNHDCDQCKALAEQPAPAQEPAAWLWLKDGTTVNVLLSRPTADDQYWLDKGYSTAPLYTAPQPPAQQEPDPDELTIAYMSGRHEGKKIGAKEGRNKLATWMMQCGFATGHGDTLEELLYELDTEIEARLAAIREKGGAA